MTATGAIAWRARTELPATWDALANASTFGDASLQMRLDFVKYTLFATVVAQSTEESVYPPPSIWLAAKKLALDLIPAGADYWSDQAINFSASARQSSEGVSYPDRISSLWRIHARLIAEVDQLQQLVGTSGSGGVVATKRRIMPLSSTDGTDFRTPSPLSFPNQYTNAVWTPFVTLP
jgi:hypothetical protein